MATKKKNKRRIKVKNIIIIILFLMLLTAIVDYITNIPVKNIYVTGNNVLSDREIIDLSGLDGYPSFVNTYFINIKEKLLNNDYIKNVKVKHKLFGKIYLDIEEYRPICIYNDELVLSSKKKIANKYNIDYVPYIISDINNIYDNAINKFSQIDDDTLYKISHIEYVPNDVDKERFLFYMIDANYVYITLSKINKINKYNSIVGELDGKKGIIYLDLGDYVEIKG